MSTDTFTLIDDIELLIILLPLSPLLLVLILCAHPWTVT